MIRVTTGATGGFELFNLRVVRLRVISISNYVVEITLLRCVNRALVTLGERPFSVRMRNCKPQVNNCVKQFLLSPITYGSYG